jgi:hypothetical protein
VTSCACACGTLDAASHNSLSRTLIDAVVNSPLNVVLTGPLTGFSGLPQPETFAQIAQSSLGFLVVFLGAAVVVSQIVGFTRLQIGEHRLKQDKKFER